MMKMSVIASVVGALLLSSSAMAVTKSSVIKLNGGTVGHNKSVTLNFGKLLDDVNYRVDCEIASDNLSNQGYDDIQVVNHNGNAIYVEGSDASNYNGQVRIYTNERPAELMAVDVYNYHNDLQIRNLDDTDTVTVANCVATPDTGFGIK